MFRLLLFIGTSELLLIGALALLLFGGKKLPELMRGLGQGVKAYKEGMREANDDNEPSPNSHEKGGQADENETQDQLATKEDQASVK